MVWDGQRWEGRTTAGSDILNNEGGVSARAVVESGVWDWGGHGETETDRQTDTREVVMEEELYTPGFFYDMSLRTML